MAYLFNAVSFPRFFTLIPTWYGTYLAHRFVWI